MAADSYVHIVQAQVNMAFGRFDSAVAFAEKAMLIDPGNSEVGMILSNVRLVAQARAQGNDLFKAGKFAEASVAYGDGLKHEPLNPVLYCNRAACWSKLGQWAKAVEDCNEVLRIQPSYTKALLRRAASYAKLERWADCVRDYEVLHKDLPGDTEVAEALFHAQVALKAACGEEVSNMKFGGEVEAITSLEQLQDAIHSPGVSVLYFMTTANQQCTQIKPSVDSLCSECPSVNFLKGLLVITASAVVPSLRPATCEGSSCPPATGFQYFVFFASLYLVSIGTGGVKSALLPFGADQYSDSNLEESKKNRSSVCSSLLST